MGKNYYAVLGLPQNATTRQIRERFLQMAREKHPDRIRGPQKAKAEIDFQDLTQAFNVLTDPERRRELDADLARPDYSTTISHSAEAAKIYLQRGAAAYREKHYSEAVENFARATEEDPENPKTWYHLAAAGRHLPRWRPRAREAAARACHLDSMNVTYLKLAGSLFAEGELHAQAAKYYRSALDWGGEDAEVEAAFEEALSAAKAERKK
ncbi:MAG: DnaJ domain-containing protein [Acidobacteriota bacterium]|nr:DnaJ domain-containing protein [Acidobacteriota bacterium]